MSTLRSRRGRLTAALGALAITLGAGACATGAPQPSAEVSHDGRTTSAEPSPSDPAATPEADPTGAAPTPDPTTPEPTPAAPTTSEAPTNQPTVVYTKAAPSVGPGEPVKITITVQTPNPGVPNGDVSLVVDGAQYASGTLDAGGNLSFTVDGLGPGEHSYQGRFAGNAAYALSDSKIKTVTVLTAEQIAAAKQKKADEEKAKQAAAAAGSPCPPSAEACIDLTSNTTWLQDDGVITAGPYKQIAGRAGHRTPTGTFTVQWKNKDHKSQEFDQAPMPYAIFFTTTGIAFHVGSLSVPSHGCIHLTESAAKVYWDALQPGDVVFVFGSAKY